MASSYACGVMGSQNSDGTNKRNRKHTRSPPLAESTKLGRHNLNQTSETDIRRLTNLTPIAKTAVGKGQDGARFQKLNTILKRDA